MMKTLKVALAERSYPIVIGENILQSPQYYVPHLLGQQVMIVSNTTIAPLWLDKVLPAFNGYQVETLILPDGEEYKVFAQVNVILTELLEKKFNRHATLVALGGGVIGDMVGFAASIYQRGIPFIQIPTTLLAQVDSSVGGKTAVNHPLGKNMIGSFYQPKGVVIDTLTLQTLDKREYYSGLAEAIKYGLIFDQDLYQWCHEHVDALKARDHTVLTDLIAASCEHKATVVAKDETEQGERAYLNLGHTFGHAIEKCQHYKGLLHGEAVAIGMVMAMDLSVRLGHIHADALLELKKLLTQLELPTVAPEGLNCREMLEAMSIDKKNIHGKLRFVLLKQIGEAYLAEGIGVELVTSILIDNGVTP